MQPAWPTQMHKYVTVQAWYWAVGVKVQLALGLSDVKMSSWMPIGRGNAHFDTQLRDTKWISWWFYALIWLNSIQTWRVQRRSRQLCVVIEMQQCKVACTQGLLRGLTDMNVLPFTGNRWGAVIEYWVWLYDAWTWWMQRGSKQMCVVVEIQQLKVRYAPHSRDRHNLYECTAFYWKQMRCSNWVLGVTIWCMDMMDVAWFKANVRCCWDTAAQS
jgi:hypothetical protein